MSTLGLSEFLKNVTESVNGKTIVVTFGRFNPPHKGHELVVNKVLLTARAKRADHLIFTSHSHDTKSNPLTFDQKIGFLQNLFRGAKFYTKDDVRTFADVFDWCKAKGYKNVFVVLGGERVQEIESQFRKYAYHPDPGKSYNFSTFEVISAGERDPDAEGISGLSASKVRVLVANNDWEGFIKAMPAGTNENIARKLFYAVATGLGLNLTEMLIPQNLSMRNLKLLSGPMEPM